MLLLLFNIILIMFVKQTPKNIDITDSESENLFSRK